MVWLLIALIIIIAEATSQDRNHTHVLCNQTQALRQGKDGEDICCHSAKCKLGEKFLLCSENDGHDICLPCSDGYFTALSVDTALVHIQFDPCMKLKCSDGAVNINGSCICDILNGYYGNDSSRCIPKNCTAGFLLTLNGHCKLCEKQDNCGKLIFERQSSDVSVYWIIVGIVLSALATAGTLLVIFWYRSRILKKLNDRNSSPDDISHTYVNVPKYRNSSPDDISHTYVNVPKFPTACSGNYKTGKKQNDLKNDYLDPVSSESLEGFSTGKEIKCKEQCMHRGLKEKEGKQQAQPLNPRPVVVVDDNLLLQEQSLSSEQNYEINDVVEVPHATAANNESEPDHSYTDAYSGETHSVGSSCNYAAACCTDSGKVFQCDHFNTDTSFHQPCKQEYSVSTNSTTHDVTNHPHDDTMPKVVFHSEDVHNGEQQYFSNFNFCSSPRANNPAVNMKLCEEEKRSEEDNGILHQTYHGIVDAQGKSTDEYGSEDQRRSCENLDDKYQSNDELDSDVNLHNTETANDEDHRSLSLTNIDDQDGTANNEHLCDVISDHTEIATSNDQRRSCENLDDKYQSNDELDSDVNLHNTETENDEEPPICTGLKQRHKDNDLPLKNQEPRKNTPSKEKKDQCAPPKESVKTKEENKTASPISREEQEPSTCTGLIQRHKDNDLLLKKQEQHNLTSSKDDKFPTSESHRPKESLMANIIKKAQSLKEENKKMEEQIVLLQDENNQQRLTIQMLQEQLEQLQMENNQQGLTIQALQESTQELQSIVQHLPELNDLLGQEPLTDISHQKDNQMRVYYDTQPETAESNAHL